MTGFLRGMKHLMQQTVSVSSFFIYFSDVILLCTDSDYDDDEDQAEENIDGKCLFICGPYGVCKTSLALSLASDHGYKVLEFNLAGKIFPLSRLCLSSCLLSNESIHFKISLFGNILR